MKNKVTILLCLCLSLGFLSSCKKEDEKSKTRTEILTGSSCWKLTKFEYGPVGGPLLDVTNEDFDPCELDDCSRFNSDGNYVTTDSGVKCDPDESIIEQGKWELTNNDEVIRITLKGEEPVDFKIKSMSNNEFVQEIDVFGFTIRTTYRN